MFIYMVSLFAVAVIAAPQYNYQPAFSQPGVFPAQSTVLAPQAAVAHQAVIAPQAVYASQGVAVPTYAAPQIGITASVPSFPIQQQPQPQQQLHVAPQVVYNKQIFIHSAPEEDALHGAGSSDEQSVLKKNLRVVIVRAPENKGLTDAALQLAKSTTEDKTVVYVLNKQTDLGELQNQLAQIEQSNPNKPEVHFVKYRTQEEAEHAQHSIQSQYDSFGGPTKVLDEGVAPVESFVGSLGDSSIGAGTTLSGTSLSAGIAQGTVAVQGQNFAGVSNAYLPVARFF